MHLNRHKVTSANNLQPWLTCMFSLLATVGFVAIVPEHLWQSSFSISLAFYPSDGPQAPLPAVLITPPPIRTSSNSQTNLYLHCVWRRGEPPITLCARDSIQHVHMRMHSPLHVLVSRASPLSRTVGGAGARDYTCTYTALHLCETGSPISIILCCSSLYISCMPLIYIIATNTMTL